MFADAVMLKKMLEIVYSIDICTRHRMSSKHVDLNICAHTWHYMSVMGNKQGFELAVPALPPPPTPNPKSSALYICLLLTTKFGLGWFGLDRKKIFINAKILKKKKYNLGLVLLPDPDPCNQKFYGSGSEFCKLIRI